ncbi:dienelactone hydrolase family protein [Sphingomonas sp.]|uniref:dienelactone hydrolase family protein n=1 Tax=Sphingomonas sp. TaxID=28214 RepID=UPI00286EAEEE|nr:dienelactone hydrolase family protein [Sphingomonas sp.]
MTDERTVDLEFGGETLSSVLFSAGGGARPAVILFPTVMGISELELGFARKLVADGYTALVADLFGRRFTPGADRDAAFAAMGALRADRAALRDRLTAILEATRAQPEIDAANIAAIGFCFGGQCALDLARSGADLAGVASFHGLFDPPGLDPQPITAKVVAFHGWDDPMVPPDAVVALGQELTAAGTDWQIHSYGNVAHGFTNPQAAAMAIPGVDYNKAAAERSWASLGNFLAELFG